MSTRLVERLARAGLLDDATGGGPAADALRAKKEVLDRLRPDLASLSLVTPEPGEAMRRLAARRSLRVQVRGAGRVGAVLAALLAGAGVGRGRRARRRLRRAVGRRAGRAARRVRSATAGTRPHGGRCAGRRRTARRGRSPAQPSEGDDPGFSLVILAPRDGLAVHAPDPSAAEP